MNIWILDGNTGVNLLYKSFLKINVDEDIISGLLTAFNQFTMVEFRQPIESIEMGGLRWIYLIDHEFELLFVAADTKDIPSSILRSRLKSIKDSFINDFKHIWFERGHTWDGDLYIFRSFKKTIEKYYFQWEEAEIMTFLADLYDLIGIIQNILNLVNKIIHNHERVRIKNIIVKKIEILFENLKSNEEVKNDPEIKKMQFSAESGFTIINMNPTNSDPIIIKKYILEMFKKTIDILKLELGSDLSMKYFKEGQIFRCLLDNIEMLKVLNLDTLFFNLFLE